MSKLNLPALAKSTKNTLAKHSPEILIGIGITSMLSTVVLAVKATPKAVLLIDDAKKEADVDELSVAETVKVAWKPYIPAIVTGALSVACIVESNSQHRKRNAALATVCAISETAFSDYKEKVIETVGEKKEQIIQDKVIKKRLEEQPVSSSEVDITPKGTTLCYDYITGKYFDSDIEILRRAENTLNRKLMDEMYVSLNEFYYEIGIKPNEAGNLLGWNMNDGLINLHFSSQIADDGRPCLVVSYQVAPRYNYGALM